VEARQPGSQTSPFEPSTQADPKAFYPAGYQRNAQPKQDDHQHSIEERLLDITA
jgi:hypothetical protein